jgi:hypothetical protein
MNLVSAGTRTSGSAKKELSPKTPFSIMTPISPIDQHVREAMPSTIT